MAIEIIIKGKIYHRNSRGAAILVPKSDTRSKLNVSSQGSVFGAFAGMMSQISYSSPIFTPRKPLKSQAKQKREAKRRRNIRKRSSH